MNKKKFITMIALFLMMGQVSFAQTLSEEEKQELQIRAKQKIEDFQGHLSTIGSRRVSAESKNSAKKAALDLFIGKGEIYWSEDAYGNRTQHDPVKMQVSSNRTGRVNSRLMKYYLNSLANMTQYTKVEIENADVVRVDNIHETQDGKYEAVAYFSQKFCGYRDGRLVYSDVTEKKVKIYVEKRIVPMPGGNNQIIWQVMLGDIYVLDTY